MTASPISAISALHKYNAKLKHGHFEPKHQAIKFSNCKKRKFLLKFWY